jgi:SAM-dependent methyltransferase
VTKAAANKPHKPHLIVRAWRMLFRLAAEAPDRGVMWLVWCQPPAAFQPFNDTAPNRYPKIFSFVRQEIAATRAPAILSFGCSTGEEVFSLRRYFPCAAIKGVDVNPGNIATARRRLRERPDKKLCFEVAGSTANEPAAKYDAIFCMAVLRHGSLGRPGVERCDRLIRFADFAAAIADFSRCLKPGGLLIVRHSNFRLCDTPTAADFETLLRSPLPSKNKSPLFGPDNRLMPFADYPDTVFRKRLMQA